MFSVLLQWMRDLNALSSKKLVKISRKIKNKKCMIVEWAYYTYRSPQLYNHMLFDLSPRNERVFLIQDLKVCADLATFTTKDGTEFEFDISTTKNLPQDLHDAGTIIETKLNAMVGLLSDRMRNFGPPDKDRVMKAAVCIMNVMLEQDFMDVLQSK